MSVIGRIRYGVISVLCEVGYWYVWCMVGGTLCVDEMVCVVWSMCCVWYGVIRVCVVWVCGMCEVWALGGIWDMCCTYGVCGTCEVCRVQTCL